jgi:signal transduction histidine kinase
VADGRLGRARERLGTVRVRTTAAAVIVAGAALVAAGVAMVVLLERSLTSDVRAAAFRRARSVAERLAVEGDSGSVAAGTEEEFVQVLDDASDVVASSGYLAGEPPVARPDPGESVRIDRLSFEDDPFLVVALSASTPRGPRTVIVGRTMETVVESSRALVSLLVIGIPLLLMVLAAVMWRIVSRALAPVESIRAEVESISTKELHRRVPDPPGNDEVARLAATMNGMLARLELGQHRQRRFVSDASHELRSPVAAIRQHAEVALTHPDGTSTQDLAEIVLAEDVRLQQLVEDLLLLTRIDEGTLHSRTESVDLDDILFEEAARLRRSTGLLIDTRGVSAARVSGDKRQLARVVRNLADNAARHARRVVALSLWADDDEVVLTVEDDGDGIPAPYRERVFERFVRLDEARDRDRGGSGLGLAIVAEIAAGYGGTVAVDDGSLGGARLEVRLPAALQDRSAEPQPRRRRMG